MLSVLAPATLLLALTVVVHSAGMIGLIHWVWRVHTQITTGFWDQTWLLVRLA